VVLDQNAAVTVVGVLAHADVGERDHLRQLLLEQPDRALDGAFRIPRRAPDRVLRFGQAEEKRRADAEIPGTLRFVDRRADRVLEDARHRADLRARTAVGDDEQRVDQVCGRDPGLADHRAHRFAAPQAPRPHGQVARAAAPMSLVDIGFLHSGSSGSSRRKDAPHSREQNFPIFELNAVAAYVRRQLRQGQLRRFRWISQTAGGAFAGQRVLLDILG
jgi:hypothetical protein